MSYDTCNNDGIGFAFIIKAVGDWCNLRCKYCFYNGLGQEGPTVMSLDLLERLTEQYLALSKYRHFIWHGGEPLLAGLDYYQTAVDLQSRHRCNGGVINALQTNGTLINDEWAEFFKRHDFRIGISIDGIREAHDRHRLTLDGTGSFDGTVRGIECLRAHGVSFGVICVLTKSTLPYVLEGLEFLYDIGAHSVGFNTYLEGDGYRAAHPEEFIGTPDLTEALRTALNFWLEKDDPSFRIREVDAFVAGATNTRCTACEYDGRCTDFLTVNYNGDVYPCERLPRKPDLLFGNVEEQSILEVLESPARKQFIECQNLSLPANCQECRFRTGCNNGCTHYRRNGRPHSPLASQGNYVFCATRKAMFTEVEHLMQNQRSPNALQGAMERNARKSQPLAWWDAQFGEKEWGNKDWSNWTTDWLNVDDKPDPSPWWAN